MSFKVFGRRRGSKISKRKISLYENVYPKIKITIPNELNRNAIDFLCFPKTDIWLEIGFGMGENLIYQIETNPNISFIGCEPYFNGIVNFINNLREKDYSRVKLFHEDARLLIRDLPDQSLSRVFILFPDPWPKKKHEKRRLLKKETLDLLAKKLSQKAKLLIATDDLNYFKDIFSCVSDHKNLLSKKSNILDCKSKPDGLIKTKYEKKAIDNGRDTFFLEIEKR